MKRKYLHPGFELWSTIPFPTEITVTLNTPQSLSICLSVSYLYIYIYIVKVKKERKKERKKDRKKERKDLFLFGLYIVLSITIHFAYDFFRDERYFFLFLFFRIYASVNTLRVYEQKQYWSRKNKLPFLQANINQDVAAEIRCFF